MQTLLTQGKAAGATNLIKSLIRGMFGPKENVRAWKPVPVMAGGLVIAFKLPGAFFCGEGEPL